MKYAFTSFSCPDAGLDEVLRMARAWGYVGFEARTGFGHRHGLELGLTSEQIAQAREAFAASGVALCCLSVSCRYADVARNELQIAETKRYLALAGALGAPLLRVFCGEIPLRETRERAREHIVAALTELAPFAEAAGVRIVVETHDDWSAPYQMAEVLAAVGHPSVGAVWDVMHTLRGGGATMAEAYRILEPWLYHVHIHDGLLDRSQLRFRAIGEGEIDHREVARILLEHRYGGFLSGEWLDWEAPEVHLPRELATMRRYEAEIATL